MFFELKKPDLTRIKRAQLFKAMSDRKRSEIFDFIKRNDSEYLYWDNIRYKEPSPKGMSKEELWMIVKIIRESQAIKSVITDKNGKRYLITPSDPNGFVKILGR